MASKHTVQITGVQVIELMRNGQRIGKESAAIELAVDWIGKSDAEISRLNVIIGALRGGKATFAEGANCLRCKGTGDIEDKFNGALKDCPDCDGPGHG